MAKLTMQKIQEQAAQILATVEDACQQLESLVEAVPVDSSEVSEDMRDWTVQPPLPFYVHGNASSALENLTEAEGQLRQAAHATPDSIAETCRRYHAGRTR
jgi:hypothetical protein